MSDKPTKFEAFGGGWSDQKLAVIRQYLQFYNTALSKSPFRRVYIDAFAGSGRTKPKDKEKDSSHRVDDNYLLFFDESSSTSEEFTKFRHGSPLLALETIPEFHEFIFIERDPKALVQLKNQIEKSGQLKGRSVQFFQEDANEALPRIAKENWIPRRAVVFLDPFALHIRWSTLQAIAKTQAMDMWLLFPAMAVNRMLPRDGEIPANWAYRLTETFGDDSWRQTFYTKEEHSHHSGFLPGFSLPSVDRKVNDPFDRLSYYFVQRLKTIFTGVIEAPLTLKMDGGAPLFLLYFAVNNKKGASIAIRIAKSILNKAKPYGY